MHIRVGICPRTAYQSGEKIRPDTQLGGSYVALIGSGTQFVGLIADQMSSLERSSVKDFHTEMLNVQLPFGNVL